MKVSLKNFQAFIVFLIIACVQCSRPPQIECTKPYMYGDSCKCIENLPNHKQLHCKNLTCNVEFSGYLRHVQGYKVWRLIVENADLSFMPNAVFEGDFMWIDISTSIFEERLFQNLPGDNKIVHLMLNEVEIADGKWDWQIVSPFKKLRTLRLRKMPLGGLQNFTLFEKTLQHIVLHDCNLKKLQDDQFQKYKKLEMVDIRHDQLTELKRSMFPTPSKIRIMIFRNNHLTSLPENLFEGMSNLTVIDFRHNRLAVIFENIFKPIKGPVILLQGNPLRCDCKMKWTLEIIMVKGECQEPEYLKGKELKHITEELSHC